jgi:hypothetical protein
MSTKRLELIVEAQAGIDSATLRKRLSHKGVETMAMKVGCLVAGETSALQIVIPSLTGDEQGGLEVPDHLKDIIKAIHVAKPRSLY